VALLTFIPLHELLQLGVYYEGCMSRRRWRWMRMAPLLGMSQVRSRGVTLEIGLQAMLVANSVGSGGDLMAASLVLRQAPHNARLCFRGGRAYWRTA
jgi:hypothetical protein